MHNYNSPPLNRKARGTLGPSWGNMPNFQGSLPFMSIELTRKPPPLTGTLMSSRISQASRGGYFCLQVQRSRISPGRTFAHADLLPRLIWNWRRVSKKRGASKNEDFVDLYFSFKLSAKKRERERERESAFGTRQDLERDLSKALRCAKKSRRCVGFPVGPMRNPSRS